MKRNTNHPNKNLQESYNPFLQSYTPPQNYGNQQSYPPQNQSSQSYSPQNYGNQQNYSPQSNYPPQNYRNQQSYPPQSNYGNQQSYPPQNYENQQSYSPQSNYPPQNYGNQQSYSPQSNYPSQNYTPPPQINTNQQPSYLNQQSYTHPPQINTNQQSSYLNQQSYTHPPQIHTNQKPSYLNQQSYTHPPQNQQSHLTPHNYIQNHIVLDDIFAKYNINPIHHNNLRHLQMYDIVIIADDSYSMTSKVKNNHRTRWNELKHIIEIVIDVGSSLDSNGIDLIFLNRKGMDNVTSYKQVKNLFKKGPTGGTPLSDAIATALTKVNNKPVILIIATDGKPNNLRKFTEILKTRNCDNVYVNILACSDQERDIGYLNKLDVEIRNLDVLDDYDSELKEVQNKQGRNYSYTFGDHIARLLVGSLFYDKMDETPRVSTVNHVNY